MSSRPLKVSCNEISESASLVIGRTARFVRLDCANWPSSPVHKEFLEAVDRAKALLVGSLVGFAFVHFGLELLGVSDASFDDQLGAVFARRWSLEGDSRLNASCSDQKSSRGAVYFS